MPTRPAQAEAPRPPPRGASALVDEVESSFAEIVGGKAFDLLRTDLAWIADQADPSGVFGGEDENE